MKQGETSNKVKQEYRKYFILGLFCFGFGFSSIILNLLMIGGPFHVARFLSWSGTGPRPNITRNANFSYTEENETVFLLRRPMERSMLPVSFFSPTMIVSMITFVMCMVAGFALINLAREKEIKHEKKKLIDTFLLPDEKTVINEIESNGGSMTQIQIAKSTGFSRVKVHRIIRSLEGKKLITKKEFGMTNKIVLEK